MRPGVVNPGAINLGGLGGLQVGGGNALPSGWDVVPTQPQRPPTPEQGFFDYDESWFDEGGQ